MGQLRSAFDERLEEIEAYLEFLEGVENQVRAGSPRLGDGGPTITAQQQRILYSSVYLQLYSLVEASITKCLDAVCDAAAKNGWKPGDLSAELRREWVRHSARTHITLTDENRLKHALEIVELLVKALPVSSIEVEKSGGSWDDKQIESITNRIGLRLRISQNVYQDVKRPLRNDKGALTLIATLRNDLAHGSLSFAECGENVLVAELRDLKGKAALYLGEVVDEFEGWIESYEFLDPTVRPNRDVA
jgi:MAE_28990/MAE_18760-like HEPN